MADDVCDCWEEIDEDGVDFKFQKLTVNADEEERVTSIAAGSSAIRSNDQQSGPAMTANSIKILKRPPGDQTTVLQRNTSANVTNRNYDMNNFVDSEPFFPRNNSVASNDCVGSNRFPQITLEDQTRTQYVKQVKILKRPEKGQSDGSGKTSPIKNSLNNGKSSKTYEEREANYAKARLRILGSAIPTYDSTATTTTITTTTTSTTTTTTTEEQQQQQHPYAAGVTNNSNAYPNPGPSRVNGDSVNRGQVEVPILRLPQGPDGSRGFTVKR